MLSASYVTLWAGIAAVTIIFSPHVVLVILSAAILLPTLVGAALGFLIAAPCGWMASIDMAKIEAPRETEDYIQERKGIFLELEQSLEQTCKTLARLIEVNEPPKPSMG